MRPAIAPSPDAAYPGVRYRGDEVIMLSLLLACAGAPKTEVSVPGDTATASRPSALDSASDVTIPDGLNGREPRSPVELPEFRALAHTGAERGRGDLLGQPSVVWFFPAANTSG